MTKSKWFGALAVVLALVGCGGGGGDSGTPPFGGGTTPTPASAVADLNVSLSKTSLQDSGSDSLTVTVTAVDASRVAVPSATVTIGADNGAVVVAASTSTDSSGKVTATVGTGADKSNRTVTVTATSGTISKTISFTVIGAKLSAAASPDIIAPGAAGKITYTLKDSTDTAIAGATIVVSASGASTTGTTDGNGEYVYNYTAPASAGILNVTTVAAGVTLDKAISVQAGGTTPLPTGTVTSASISVDPSVIPINSGTSNNRANIRALFLGANNAPVQYVRVRFDLAGDVNSIGGTLSTDTTLIPSDENGLAVSAYSPGSRSSPTNGVTIRACWDYNDFAVGTCPNSVTKTLTVTSEALAVSIGFDATISEGSGGLTYVKKFVVTVADAAGQAKSDVQVTPSIDLVNYIKGSYQTPGAWALKPGSGQMCANEDINRNGVLEATEDFNGNGQLDPRKSDVLVSVVGSSSKTNSSGIVILQIEYPKNVATWIQYKLSVTAGGVSGTEGRASLTKILTADAASFTATEAPAFVVSPYGVGSGAPTTYTPPGGSPITVCTDPS
jgi:hypothetical protein